MRWTLCLASGLGADMGGDSLSYAGNKYGARHGSVAVGLYNGSGYHGDERNVDKTVEARLTWRPLPDMVKGLQVAGLVIHGDGNVEDTAGDAPTWKTLNAFVSYQFLHGTVTAQDLEGQGRGDMEVRLKYALAKFHWRDVGVFNEPNLELGIVHMVWLDFEEHINLYRMRGPMFMERSGIFNSADFGVTLASGLGADMGGEYLSYAGNKYGARHGSVAVGLYNGSGYHGDERNVDKTVEARLTWRPLPDMVKGLQVAGLVIHGDGNVEDTAGDAPTWKTLNAFVSYQFLHGTVTAQVVEGEGNQRGSWVEPDDPSEAMDFSGWSVFAEWRLGPRHEWRLIGGWDDFERVAENGRDHSFRYSFLAVGYGLGRNNILMLDVDQRDWRDPARDTDRRAQLVLQLSF